MPRSSPLDDHSVPSLSWDIAAAIGGFRLEEQGNGSGHKVAIGRSRRFGDVAVKAYVSLAKAAGERDRLLHISELDIPAITPLDVAVGGLANYLVTRRERGLRNWGQLTWARTIADRETNKLLLPALEQGGRDIAGVHNAGVTHGDLHPGNVMYRDDDFIVGDVESSNVNVSGIHRTRGAARDLHRLGASLAVQHGFLGDRSPSFRAGALRDHLLAPYSEVGTTPLDQQQIVEGWTNAVSTGRISHPRSNATQTRAA